MNICPNPLRWSEIFKTLHAACKERQVPTTPPTPLVLNGWVYSNDVEKAQRWRATDLWARENGLADLIVVRPEEWYSVERLHSSATSPLGGRMHLSWKFEPAAIPSAANVAAALSRLTENWGYVAGKLSKYTRPYRITRAKARRLVVLLSPSAPPPPWGDWKMLPHDESRRAFTKLRQAINAMIAPEEIDHVEFEIEGTGAANHTKKQQG